jgi:hypothetical protein
MPGIKDGPGEVKKRVSGEICPKKHISCSDSNPRARSGVKAGDIIKAYISHD